MITQKEIRRLFSYNRKTVILRWKVKSSKRVNVGDEAGCKRPDGYIQIIINKKKYLAHRIIWCGKYGYFPENMIDHKDKIPWHNWISNLRESSNQCNIRNTGNFSNNTSGVKGVFKQNTTNKWIANIRINNKLHHLGLYKSFDDAVCARLAGEQCVGWNGCDSNSPAYKYVQNNIIRS